MGNNVKLYASVTAKMCERAARILGTLDGQDPEEESKVIRLQNALIQFEKTITNKGGGSS